MRGVSAENAGANGPASRTRSKFRAPGGGQVQAAKPATAVHPPSGKAPSQPQPLPQPQPVPRELVQAALLSPPATAQLCADAAVGAEQERRQQEEACMGQLRMLLGSYDQLPPGDLKFLIVMRKVAAIWAPGEGAVDTVEDAHEVLLKLLARFEQDKLAPWERTPVARRAMLRYVQSAMG